MEMQTVSVDKPVAELAHVVGHHVCQEDHLQLLLLQNHPQECESVSPFHSQFYGKILSIFTFITTINKEIADKDCMRTVWFDCYTPHKPDFQIILLALWLSLPV